MSIKKFVIHTSFLRAQITEVEVLRETDACVYVSNGCGGERREGKVTSYSEYHDTWEKAHDRLIELADIKVGNARRQLQTANDVLGNIKGMKRPGEQA